MVCWEAPLITISLNISDRMANNWFHCMFGMTQKPESQKGVIFTQPFCPNSTQQPLRAGKKGREPVTHQMELPMTILPTNKQKKKKKGIFPQRETGKLLAINKIAKTLGLRITIRNRCRARRTRSLPTGSRTGTWGRSSSSAASHRDERASDSNRGSVASAMGGKSLRFWKCRGLLLRPRIDGWASTRRWENEHFRRGETSGGERQRRGGSPWNVEEMNLGFTRVEMSRRSEGVELFSGFWRRLQRLEEVKYRVLRCRERERRIEVGFWSALSLSLLWRSDQCAYKTTELSREFEVRTSLSSSRGRITCALCA